MSAHADLGVGRRPFLLRFAYGWPQTSGANLLDRAPAKVFPSFWANVACLTDRERDFFVQCVELIRHGAGMSITPPVAYVMDRLADMGNSDERHAQCSCSVSGEVGTICDVVFLHDGCPCTGWFHDKYGCEHYHTLVAAMEKQWSTSPASLWILREHSVATQPRSMTAGAWQDNVFSESCKWSLERMNAVAARHGRFADKEAPQHEKTVEGIRRLSLSLLGEATEAKKESLLAALSEYVSSRPAHASGVGFSNICYSYGCLAAVQIKGGAMLAEKVSELGKTISSIKHEDVLARAHQRLVDNLLRIVNGTPLHVPSRTAEREDVGSWNVFPGETKDVDKLLSWFPQVVANSQALATPSERDACLTSVLLAVPFIEQYVTKYETSIIRHHAKYDRQRPGEGCFNGVVDASPLERMALDRVLCSSTCNASQDDAMCISSSCCVGGTAPSEGALLNLMRDCGGEAWMPGVGLDSSFYISNLLSACDALSGMLGVPEKLEGTETASQLAVHRLRHKLRVHVIRRFNFINASRVWRSDVGSRALPFLNALRSSLHHWGAITILRFRNGDRMPNAFDAVNEPSTVLQSFAPLHLCSLTASPRFFVECGTVQELEEIAGKQDSGGALRCSFTPSGSCKRSETEYVLPILNNLAPSLLSASKSQIMAGSHDRFVDVVVLIRNSHATVVPPSPCDLLRQMEIPVLPKQDRQPDVAHR
ncbi:hypothetical protein TRVL_00109 [Trypanosoma vivax]|nr:hypothetical protein TRVL_00109 [Trypanosoma vivax]